MTAAAVTSRWSAIDKRAQRTLRYDSNVHVRSIRIAWGAPSYPYLFFKSDAICYHNLLVIVNKLLTYISPGAE